MAEQKVKLTQLPEATDTIDAAVLLVNQNETDQRLPITHFLRSKNNLSELENTAQARANLGVPSVDDVNDKVEYLIDGKSTFLNGATLESERDFIWDDNSKNWYYWTGAFSKEVPAASNPESTGGIGTGKWVSVSDAVLRGQISDPESATKYPEFQLARWRDEGDVRGWGAVGDGVTDDHSAIQAALNGGNKRVYIPKGTYLIKSTLQIFNKTDVVMDMDTIILNDSGVEWAFSNGEIGNPTYSYGYDGDGDITISGGVVDNIIKQEASVNSCAIGFAHGKNIKILNVTFKNNYSSHFVEINSCKNVIISGCIFYNLITNIPGSRACINVDWSNAGGFPAFGGYDGTVCDDVLITDCTFINGDIAVDSHGKPSDAIPEHKNIRFVNNHLENMASGGVGCQFWNNAIVSGNTIKDCNGRNIICWGSVNVNVSNNIITGSKFSAGIVIDNNSGRICNGILVFGNKITGGQSIGAYGIRAKDSVRINIIGNIVEGSPDQGIIINTGCRDVSVSSNTVIGAGQRGAVNESISVDSIYVSVIGNCITKGTYDVSLLDGILIGGNATSNVEVGSNAIYDTTRSLVNVSASVSGVIVDGAYVLHIAPNTAKTVPMNNMQHQGIFQIQTASSVAEAINGIVWARGVSGQSAINVIAKASSATWDTATGTLNGTTGTSGRMTVSAGSDNKLYIENRLAATVQVTCTKIQG